jgi:hypothetical protein
MVEGFEFLCFVSGLRKNDSSSGASERCALTSASTGECAVSRHDEQVT